MTDHPNPDNKSQQPAPGLSTQMVHHGQIRSPHKETAEALYLTSGFVYDSAEEADARFAGASPGYLYGRYANPTMTMLEDRLCALEGAQSCLVVGSGMAAVHTAVLALVKAGDRVIASRALFGSCLWLLDTLLPRYGVEVSFVDGEDLAQWRQAAQRPAVAALIETPANPTLAAVDIAAVRDILAPTGALLIADNAFASPIVQRPIDHGADIVTYSTTKHMDGQGRTLGGAILSSRTIIDDHYREFVRHTGPALSPFNAWVVLKGLETLKLRVDAQSRTAAAIADVIAAHPAATKLFYPGRSDHPQADIHAKQMKSGGTLIAFEVKGARAGAFAFLNALKLVLISNNLGDAKSLATHPATTTHRRLDDNGRAAIGVSEGLLRLSVGLEDAPDLIEDVRAALDTVSKNA
jgi:O-succinylhomoserine sulfhydrylase